PIDTRGTSVRMPMRTTGGVTTMPGAGAAVAGGLTGGAAGVVVRTVRQLAAASHAVTAAPAQARAEVRRALRRFTTRRALRCKERSPALSLWVDRSRWAAAGSGCC